MDFSQLSDEELTAIANGDATPEMPKQGAKPPKQEMPDFASLSDEELTAIAEGRDPNERGALEVMGRGLLHGASLGHSDEAEGVVRGVYDDIKSVFTGKHPAPPKAAPIYDDLGRLVNMDELGTGTYNEHRDRARQENEAARKSSPVLYGASEMGGAIASSLLPGLGAAKTIGGLAKTGATAGGIAGLGASEADLTTGDPSEWGQAIADSATGAAFGGVAGAGFGYAGRGIAKGASKLGEKVKQLSVPEKHNADQIRQAAKELGIEPTPGMLKDSDLFGKLEDDLSKSPSAVAAIWGPRKATQKVRDGIQGVADDLVKDQTSLSRFESGEAAKKSITEAVDKKFAPSRELFQELSEYTKDINVTDRSAKAVAKNIGEIPEVRLLDDGKAASVARSIQKALLKNPSVDEVKTLRGIVGKEMEAATGADKSALSQIYGKLGRLEESTIRRGVVASARNAKEGDLIQTGMIGQLRDAKRGYREQIGNVKEFAKDARLGKVYDPKTFSAKVDDVASEKVQDKLFNLSDNRVIENLKTQYPEAYQYLREAKLAEIAKGASNQAGELDAGRLLRNTAKLGPEAQEAVFRDGTKKLGNLRTVYNAKPPISGPSGTPEGFDIKSIANIGLQLRDIGRVAVYRIGSDKRLEETAKVLMTSPKFQKLAQDDPKVFRAAVFDIARRLPEKGQQQLPKVADDDTEKEFERFAERTSPTKMSTPPLKGKEKWASDGYKKLVSERPELKAQKDKLMQSKKGKQLLIEASSLKPGSRAWQNTMKKIDKHLEEQD